MKPVFRLTINRQELTEAMKDRVLSIKVEDAAGYENDNCVIEIDGRAPFPKFPKSGAIMEVAFGYAEMPNVVSKMELMRMGIYELADIDWRGTPWKLELNFNAMSMLKFPKTARNDEHENTTLKKLVEKLAKRMGYQPDVHPEFEKVKIAFEQQKNITDMEFVNQLAQRYGAFPKVLNQIFRFHPKDGSNFVDELLMLEQIIPGTLNYHSQVRALYGNIQAATFSWDTGQLQRIDVDPDVEELKDAPATMELSRLYDTAEKARAAVNAKQQFLNAQKDTLSFKIGGNPCFQSHRKIRLGGEGWHPDIPTEWIIVSSTHHWTKGEGEGSGYTTEVTCEVLTDGQRDSDNEDNDLEGSEVGRPVTE